MERFGIGSSGAVYKAGQNEMEIVPIKEIGPLSSLTFSSVPHYGMPRRFPALHGLVDSDDCISEISQDIASDRPSR